MAVNSKLLEVLPEGYGYVILVGVGSICLNMWMAVNVSKARKEYGIDYPTMYSKDNVKFNCIQRAHQNTLELYTPFLFSLLAGGLQYPKISAAAGTVYLMARVAFAKGYYTGDPDKRKQGGIPLHVALLCLFGNALSFGIHATGWVGEHECFGYRF